MRKSILFIVVMYLICTGALAAENISSGAKAAVLIDASTGRVLYARNADEMLSMASTTKIMTALLALEYGDLSAVVEAPEEACGISGTSIYLTEGEHLTLEQLLYGLMLRSGNDAATAIAIHIAGEQADFVNMMNEKAAEMGIDASFANPHGLDASGHKASAKAMVMIMREAMLNDDFARITATEKKIIPWEGNEYSRVLYNKNRLLKSYEGTTGGKTGYTGKAGRCLVFSAERNGLHLIGCVLNCSTWFDTAERMLDYGFENYSAAEIYKAGECVETIPVTGGQSRSVGIETVCDINVPLGLDESYTVNLEINKAVAPVKMGETAGRINILIDGEIVFASDVVYSATVEENDMENALKRIISMWPAKF